MDKANLLTIIGLILVIILLIIWIILFLPCRNLSQYQLPLIQKCFNEKVDKLSPPPLNEINTHIVPKIIFRTHRDKASIIPYKKAWDKTESVLPDWRQVFFSNQRVENWIKKTFGADSEITKAYFAINPKFGAARADLFRYLVIYVYGGLYLDIKSSVIKKLPEFGKDEEIMVSGWFIPQQTHIFQKGEYENWFIYAKPRSKVLWSVIEKVVQNIKNQNYSKNSPCGNMPTQPGSSIPSCKTKVLGITGPIAFTMAVNNFIKRSGSKKIKIVGVDLDHSLSYVTTVAPENLDGNKHYSRLTNENLISQKSWDNMVS